MGRKLPPLAAVRAFEAAARHESFTAAAAELNITQSAISHQVKRLEEYFGRPLFIRSAQGLSLSEDARAFQLELTGLLDRLDEFTHRIAHPGEPDLLRIRATPAFISRWLLPRMPSFAERNPDLDYEISIGFPPTDFSKGDVDIFFHWGAEPVAGARVEPFLECSRSPVASPEFLANRPAIRDPADLLHVPLIYDLVDDGWATWFKTVGLEPPAIQRGPRLAHCELAIVAAEAGQGVDLSYLALIDCELADGRLVRLFDSESPPFIMYSLAYREIDARLPKIRSFRDWAFEQLASAKELRLNATSQAVDA